MSINSIPHGNKNELDLHHLQVLDVLLREHGLTRAAKVLSLTQPALSKTFLAQGGGKLIFTDLIGVPYWIGALALAAVLVVILIVMEAWKPWRYDLGNDVDGDIAPTTPATPRGIQAVPAE